MGKVIYKHRLEGKTKYSLCPYCYRDMRSAGLETDALPQVWYIKTEEVEMLKGEQKKYFEETYFCDRCKRKMSVEDWTNAYTKPYVMGGEG